MGACVSVCVIQTQTRKLVWCWRVVVVATSSCEWSCWVERRERRRLLQHVATTEHRCCALNTPTHRHRNSHSNCLNNCWQMSCIKYADKTEYKRLTNPFHHTKNMPRFLHSRVSVTIYLCHYVTNKLLQYRQWKATSPLPPTWQLLVHTGYSLCFTVGREFPP